MDEKRVATRTVRDERPAVEEEQRTPEVARGSGSMISSEQLARVSQPRLPSRAPLSVFQMPEETRKSETEILPPVRPPNARPYMIAIIVLLFAMVSILAYVYLVLG